MRYPWEQLTKWSTLVLRYIFLFHSIRFITTTNHHKLFNMQKIH